MKTSINCDQFRAMLVDEPATAEAREVFEAHRFACPDCAEEARRDVWLREALERGVEETPPAVTWTQVLAARSPRRKPPVGRVALAFATAMAVAALLLVHPAPRPSSGPGPGQPIAPPAASGEAVATDAAPFTGTHALLSASDMTGDPNRNVILLYANPPGGRG